MEETVHLSGKSSARYPMLRAVTVLRAVMKEHFFDLIAVGERPGRDIDRERVLRPRVRPEDERLARVVQHSGHL